MRIRQLFILLSMTAAGLNAAPPGATQAGRANDARERCDALRSADFSGIPDASTRLIGTKLVDPSGDSAGYCEVSGNVTPSDRFLLRLPSAHWNRKFIELGCGGPCGSTAHIVECDDQLRRGYACIVSDGGHKSSGLDVKWAASNQQAVIEYFVRASHVTAVAGKTIAQRYYGQAPHTSYFMGCSSGGIQAMWEAQRFPWDFDGIVAGAPALNVSANLVGWLWVNRALTGKNGKPLLGHDDLEVLHQAVVVKCDLNDGIKDGVIGDPRACGFDPTELRCSAGKTSQCLTAQQTEAIEKIYRGPVTSKGEQIAMAMAMKGSERTWSGLFDGSVGNPTSTYNYATDWFRYAISQPSPRPTWNPGEFDFDRDYQRLGMAEITAPINPDLRRFKARGGKLLSYTGWNDAIEGVRGTVDYYETAERTMGGRAATQDFFRLFVIPGMNHCSGGDGAYAVDYLSYIEAWVEKGQAPEKLVGSHIRLDNSAGAGRLRFPLDLAKIEFSRPVYPYPVRAKYLGHGDPNDAANFGPVEP